LASSACVTEQIEWLAAPGHHFPHVQRPQELKHCPNMKLELHLTSFEYQFLMACFFGAAFFFLLDS